MSKKNTALITGASSGIGKEFAYIHAQKGGDLIVVARSKDKLDNLKTELEKDYGITVTVIVEDLSDPNSAERIYKKTQNLGIEVHTLINNAGFGGHGFFHERDLKVDQSMMQVNMATLTSLTHYYIKGMIERKSGRILNVSSTASFLPGPLQAVYYATKAYVTSLTQAIAEEVKDSNVTVTALCPGFVKTDFVKAGNLEGLGAWDNAASPRSVAEFGYKAMEQGDLVAINEIKNRFLIGWIIPFMPRKLVLKLSRSMLEK